MILNAKGRYERIYVNLEAMYPTPEIDGTEMCSEELMARERGYLDVQWEPELPQVSRVQPEQKQKGGFDFFSGEEPASAPQEAPKPKKKGGFAIFSGEEDAAPAPREPSLSRTFEDKMEIGGENSQAPMLDENGQLIQPTKQGKQRRIKRVEVNETQTSKKTTLLILFYADH